MGLTDTHLACVQREREELRQADAAKISVAVAERGQLVFRAQPLERGTHIREQIQLVACGKEHFKSALGHLFSIAALASVAGQRGDA